MNLKFLCSLDWSGGCTISCGTSGTGETPQAKAEEAHRPPRGVVHLERKSTTQLERRREQWILMG
ncbi:hypothetical protein FZC78_15465 [Rossellomorea vietnamensis]|uniref:Uncharacterized protein n=1 Tax=Rossellomorea vietnamensis TaxID=218284 RepID=A0A5D4NNA0_9BACI|nr:hypothetical protein [Rossellomorea vietnamensis]TYS15400.1 hypothetical protein FZC78_15465 [Rossellomorea vietnamensis]